jgi:hypothetical protein
MESPLGRKRFGWTLSRWKIKQEFFLVVLRSDQFGFCHW